MLSALHVASLLNLATTLENNIAVFKMWAPMPSGDDSFCSNSSHVKAGTQI